MSASTLEVYSTAQSLGVSSIMPSGLVSGVAGSATITLTGVSPKLSASSVITATVQVPDQAGGGLNVWLVSATPSSANGGTIEFTSADVCSSPTTTYVVAWSVHRF
jgi:hypothetical protein